MPSGLTLKTTTWALMGLVAAFATSNPPTNAQGEARINADVTCRNLPSVNACKRAAAEIHNTCGFSRIGSCTKPYESIFWCSTEFSART